MNKAKDTKHTTTLYDAGAGGIMTLVLGIPVLGSIVDGIWNYIVLTFTLRLLTKDTPVEDPPLKSDSNPFQVSETSGEITREDKIIYTVIITIAGFFIDMAYVFMIWNPFTEGEGDIWWEPRLNIGLQLSLMIVPIVLLMLSNYSLAWRFLGLPRKKAWILGIVMAVLTAPWILAILPRYN